MPNTRYSTRGRTLTVSEATYRDAGTYTCTATNEAGTYSTSISIEIQGKNNCLAIIINPIIKAVNRYSY